MLKSTLFTIAIGLALGAPLLAQPPASPQPAPPPAGTVATAPRPQTPVRNQNVKIDLTIVDSLAAADKRTVSLIVQDGQRGSMRSSGGPAGQGREYVLNVDATPEVRDGSLVRAVFSVDYRPYVEPEPGGRAEATGSFAVNQQIAVVLQSGKPLLITQALDPTSKRRITLEATATVLR